MTDHFRYWQDEMNEHNRRGTNRFIGWCCIVAAEVMIAVLLIALLA